MMRRCSIFALLSCTFAAMAAQAGEKLNQGTDREEVSIAIYNDSLALIKEVRHLDLDRGTNDIALRDVSARMQPETAALRALSGPPLRLLEQNFDFDLLTPQKLLDKYVGQTVTMIFTNPVSGIETREDAQVLSTNNGTVFKFADRIEIGPPGRVVFKTIPANLRDRPTLVVRLESPSAGKQTAELSYLSGGFSWKADYVAELAADESQLDLAGWVTLTNQSGTGFDNVRLQLVAGDVNRAQQAFAGKVYPMAAMAPAGRMEMAREEVFDYHLYTLGRPTSIRDNQTKQVALLSAAHVPVRKEYVLAGEAWYYGSPYGDPRKQKIAVFLEFENAGGDLGVPLPKGVVRVYKKDSHGDAIFIGEDAIDHTAKKDKVRLKMGNAFDVSATRKQVSFRKLSASVSESAWHLELSNAKETAVIVKVVEPMSGDWEITSESAAHEAGDARSAVWKVAVPAGGKAILDYTVKSR